NGKCAHWNIVLDEKTTHLPSPREIGDTASDLAQYKNGATRTRSKWAYSLIPPAAIRALAERFWLGKLIHGSSNWHGGIPFSACLDHLEEHLQRFKEGFKDIRRITPKDDTSIVPFDYTDGDVEHLAAIMWGAAAMIHYIVSGRSDLDDRQYGKEKK